MTDLVKFVADLRTYDEGCGPADGWYVAYNDLQKCADIIERLSARGFQDLHHETEQLTAEVRLLTISLMAIAGTKRLIPENIRGIARDALATASGSQETVRFAGVDWRKRAADSSQEVAAIDDSHMMARGLNSERLRTAMRRASDASSDVEVIDILNLALDDSRRDPKRRKHSPNCAIRKTSSLCKCTCADQRQENTND